MNDLLNALRAAAEPTRLRILSALATSELSVGELCQVLDQSQPRVSRHLKVLCEAGLLVRHADGASAYYRPAGHGTGPELCDALLALIDRDDPMLERDLHRLGVVRAERAAMAADYFESIASDWDRVRDLHVADDQVEQAMLAAVADLAVGDLLDIGTGTGRILEVFAPTIRRGLGIDLSSKMLNLARSRLDVVGRRHCSVRKGSAHNLELDAGTIDVAVLHHVLHFLDDPAEAVRQAARTLRPHGRLMVVDFGPHHVDALRTDFAHVRLGYADEEIRNWCERAGLIDVTATHFAPQDLSDDQQLPVVLWIASQRADAPSTHRLEDAS